MKRPLEIKAPGQATSSGRSAQAWALKNLSAIKAMSDAAAGSLGLPQIYAAFLEPMAEVLSLDYLSIYLLDPEADTLEVACAYPVMASLPHPGDRLALKEAPFCWAGEMGRAHLMADLEPESGPPWLLRLSQMGFRSLASVPLRAQGRLLGQVNLSSRQPRAYSQDHLEALQTAANLLALALHNASLSQEWRQAKERAEAASRALSQAQGQMDTLHLLWAGSMVQCLEAKDIHCQGHSGRVKYYARLLGRHMGLPSEALRTLELAAELHDLGKIGIPNDILQKPGPLTVHERMEIQLHPERTCAMVRALPFAPEIIPLIQSHHEKWNGSGYPNGISGEDIPPGGRILAIADAYDAMTSYRLYRPAMTQGQALAELQQQAGQQLDPAMVSYFLKALAQDEASQARGNEEGEAPPGYSGRKQP